MAKDKSNQVNFTGLELLCDSVTQTNPTALAAGSVVDASVNASAAIARTKLAAHGIAVVATADATDPATTMALVNILKAKINAMLAAGAM